MEILHSIILGTVQGLTELLPISSSAHLWVIPYVFGWAQKGLAFDTALHIGTVIAVIGYFWSDWVEIIGSALGKTTDKKYPANFLWQIIIATIPAGIAGVLLDKVATRLETPIIITITMAIFGLALWLVDKNAKNNKETKKIGYKQSFLIGCAQCLALVPGVSRSGITLVAARSLGYNREEAARFSFLIGTPAIIGAFAFEARKLTLTDLDAAFFLGIIFSAIFGFIAIKFLLDYLKKSDFSIFAIYRFLFAAILLGVYLSR